MRRLFFLLTLLSCLFLAGQAFALNSEFAWYIDGQTVAAGATGAWSTAVVIGGNQQGPNGYFSLQVMVTGDGTLAVDRQTTNDTAHWPDATEYTTVLTGLTAKTYQPVTLALPVCKAFRLRLRESGGASAAVGSVNVGWARN